MNGSDLFDVVMAQGNGVYEESVQWLLAPVAEAEDVYETVSRSILDLVYGMAEETGAAALQHGIANLLRLELPQASPSHPGSEVFHSGELFPSLRPSSASPYFLQQQQTWAAVESPHSEMSAVAEFVLQEFFKTASAELTTSAMSTASEAEPSRKPSGGTSGGEWAAGSGASSDALSEPICSGSSCSPTASSSASLQTEARPRFAITPNRSPQNNQTATRPRRRSIDSTPHTQALLAVAAAARKNNYNDDHDRMVYISWIPKQTRAYTTIDRRRMELELKRKLREDLHLEGVTKVLLFPPKGAHCKLIFDKRASAEKFMAKYGGDDGSAESEVWKYDICRAFGIVVNERFSKTVVKIEWSQK